MMLRRVFPAAARRLMSSSARPALTLEQALSANHLILGELESDACKSHLTSVASSGDTLSKWQQTNAVLVSATVRMLPQFGFPADATGLHGYSEAYAERQRSEPPEVQKVLRELNESKWRILLRHAFECEPAEPMTLEKARELAIDMVDALQDETLLGQVEQARDGLASRLPDNEKQHMVARALVGVQLEVVEKHGFKGDQGYAQAQVRARGRRGGRPRPGPLRLASGAPWRTRYGGTHHAFHIRSPSPPPRDRSASWSTPGTRWSRPRWRRRRRTCMPGRGSTCRRR